MTPTPRQRSRPPLDEAGILSLLLRARGEHDQCGLIRADGSTIIHSLELHQARAILRALGET